MERFTEFIKYYAINIGILLVFSLIIIGLTLSYWSKLVLIERNEFTTNHSTMTSHIKGVSNNVILLDLGLRGYYMTEQDGFLSPYESSMRLYVPNLDNLKTLAEKYNYLHTDSIDYIKKEIINYEHMVTKAIDDIRNGHPEKAAATFNKDPGYHLWQKYQMVLDSLTAFFQELEDSSRAKYEIVTKISFISQLTLLFIGLPVLIFVLRQLKKNDTQIHNLFISLEDSNKKYVFNWGGSESNTKTDQNNIINALIDNLKKASSFIQSITQVNLDVQWEGLDESNLEFNKNTISGELITMREQMRKVKEEETKRFWITDGLSKFAEIVRVNQDDLSKLSELLIAETVRYTKSNHGGLFLLKKENNEQFLELTGCYAYDRKKFMEKRIAIGQGLLGQAFLEGNTMKLNEIPDGYLTITSGLGNALPKNLIIVPLKTNEHIEGVMELASFNDYEKYQINFLEKLGEILASAVIYANNSIRTKELLETAQQNEEEMRSQEEEMRQNMEELQATQEEMHRKEQEYIDRIANLEKQISN